MVVDMDRRHAILHRYALAMDDKIGEGAEAEVYALGPNRVLKIFQPGCDPATIDSRRKLYALLDANAVAFALPRIIEHSETGGVHYTIEARMVGRSLTDVLPHLRGTHRSGALLAYAEAAMAIRKIGCPMRAFGEIVSAPPLLADSWPEFVLARVEMDLGRSLARVASTIDRPHRAIDRIGRLLAKRPAVEPRLVHGDYYPANVIVDAQGRTVGVIDFGGLTLSGAPRLDAAASVLHLTGHDGITEADKQVVLGHLGNRGLTDDDLYRLFHAFRFLDTPRTGLLRGCLDTIRAACRGRGVSAPRRPCGTW